MFLDGTAPYLFQIWIICYLIRVSGATGNTRTSGNTRTAKARNFACCCAGMARNAALSGAFGASGEGKRTIATFMLTAYDPFGLGVFHKRAQHQHGRSETDYRSTAKALQAAHEGIQSA